MKTMHHNILSWELMQGPGPGPEKAASLEISAEELKKDLNDLEAKIPDAQRVLFDTQVLALRNDIDHLMDKRKGLKKTHEKTDDKRRGLLGNRQERMKNRTDKNETTLQTIEANFDALDDKIYEKTGVVSERRARKQLKRALDYGTQQVMNSGALIRDPQGNIIGVDQSKVDNTLAANMQAGQQLWKGDVSGTTIVNSGAQGVVAGGMKNLGYQDKNIQNTVMIAKVLVGLLVFNAYRNKTHGLGEKLFWGIAMYGLLSNNALGGWDMFWKGGQNPVLNINNLINGGSSGSTAEVARKTESLTKGKEKVLGLKTLFKDPAKLKEYMKYDGATTDDEKKRTFDNKAFIENYGLDALKGQENPKPKAGYALTDLNEDVAGGVIVSLIQAHKLGKDAELNTQLSGYLAKAGVKDVDEMMKLTEAEMDERLSKAIEVAKKEVETKLAANREKVNKYIETNFPGQVVMEGREEEVQKIIDDGTLTMLEKNRKLQTPGLLRPRTKTDVMPVSDHEKQLSTSLIALGYTEANATNLIQSLAAVKTTLLDFSGQNPDLVIEGTTLYYQNHGFKIPINSKTSDEQMKFDLSSIGLGTDVARGTTGFTSGLLIADSICNLLPYIGTLDESDRTTLLATAGKTGNDFPFERSETFKKVEIHSQASLFSWANTNVQINKTLGVAFENGKGGFFTGNVDHTKIEGLLTSINSAKIDGKSAWIKGTGVSIPAALTVGSASGVDKLNIEYTKIQTIGDACNYINETAKNGVGMLWGDVVALLEKGGTDVGELTKKAIPGIGKVFGVAYDEVKKGTNIFYEDMAGSYERDPNGKIVYEYSRYNEATKAREYGNTTDPLLKEHNGGKITNFHPRVNKTGWFSTVYQDGKMATTIVGPDIKGGANWVIETTGDLTKEAIDQAVGAINQLMTGENLEKLKKAVEGVGGLVGKTVEQAGEIIKNAVNGTIKGVNDTLRTTETWKLIGAWALHQFVTG